MRFNSKLVRLKVTCETPFRLDSFLFQFQTGSIKRAMDEKEYGCWLGFNSKLVRLKDVDIGNNDLATGLFQFQTGSIKSAFDDKPSKQPVSEFQFQTGSIKRFTTSCCTLPLL